MKRRYSLALILLALWMTAPASRADESPEINPPSEWSLPRPYLRKFPLGIVSDQELLTALGAPASTATAGETIVWTYEVGAGRDLVRWSYVMTDGIVTDVLYRAAHGRHESALEYQSR
jgi:hypothetical protein